MRGRTGTPLPMLAFAGVGVPVTLLCIAYMATVGRRWLPTVSGGDRMRAAQLPEELARAYDLRANLFRMKVVEESTIRGRSLRDAGIGQRWQLEVLLVQRPRGSRMRSIHPTPDLVFETGDEVYMEGEDALAWDFAEEANVQFGLAGPRSLGRVLGHGVTLAEVTLPPRSEAIGKTFRELEFRKAHGLSVLAMWRRGEVLTQGLADTPLALGDGFLVSGGAEAVRALKGDHRYIVMAQGIEAEDVRQAPVALGLLAAALLPPLLGWLPLAVSAMGAALLMVATRCVSVSALREATDFRILFLIAGTIPLGIALEQRGVASGMAAGVLALEPALGGAGVLAVLFVVAAVLSTTSNNGAAAVILAPVAWEVAHVSGLAAEKTFMAVAFGTSCAFLLPFAHQCNLLVMSPGGYATRDFARVGLGMSLVMGAGTVLLLTLL
jgi:di/tricarboxylate transporter